MINANDSAQSSNQTKHEPTARLAVGSKVYEKLHGHVGVVRRVGRDRDGATYLVSFLGSGPVQTFHRNELQLLY